MCSSPVNGRVDLLGLVLGLVLVHGLVDHARGCVSVHVVAFT